MQFHKTERVGLFIDGANLYSTVKATGMDIDYKRLLATFREHAVLVRAYYYTILADEQEHSPIRPLVDWLDYNGFTVVTRAARDYVDVLGSRKPKGSMDVDLAVDAMRFSQFLDHIVIVSGDGCFKALVQSLQHLGKRVSVVSTLQTQPHMISDDLRRQADQFIDIVDLKPLIDRSVTGSKGQRRTK